MWVPAAWLVGLLAITARGVVSLCTFPEFLRRPTSEGKQRVWITETHFLDNTYLWETQREITVKEDEIVAKLKYKAQCNDFSGTVPCFHREILYKVLCIDNEHGGKFRVQHRVHNGRSYFTCLKFQERGPNIVQVWEGPQHEDDNHELCNDHLLTRMQWPWLAPKVEDWSFCPFVGGYDFRTYMFERRKKMCHKVWRPSRLESECVPGEGYMFTFPEKSCSPFEDHRDVVMQCWGSWKEGEFTFVIAAEQGRMPQYVLRFPRELEDGREFSAELYFSPVCPADIKGKPTGNIDVRKAELKMKRSEPGMCYDESPLCSRFSEMGKCNSQELHEYANYCKRSCGLCSLLPSPRAECRFPPLDQGEWHLFEKDRHERVSIHSGLVKFSATGEFICKTKHWVNNYYKMLSYYINGCRPRYTCIHFEHSGDLTLNYQISHSNVTDNLFELCNFHDDPEPLGSLIRSSEMKTLIPSSITLPHSCGLTGIVHVNATFKEGYRCPGTLSDWSRHNCDTKVDLRLTLPGCDGGYDINRDFICVSYINMHDGLSYLITKDPGLEERYNCWMIRTFSERMNYKPWREAFMLPRAQCGNEIDLDPSIRAEALLILDIPSDRVSKPCRTDTPTKPLPGVKEVRATQPQQEDKGTHEYWANSNPAPSHRTCTQPLTPALIAGFLLLHYWLDLT